MARGVNKVILIGNLGRDPELRFTQGGTAVANFSLATTERAKRDGEWTDHTEWHNIVVFGKSAENSSNFLSKGSTVYIEGRIQSRKWQDKEGHDRTTTEIVANTIQFLGGGKGGSGGGGARASGHASSGGSSDSFPDEGGFDPNDDVPF